MKLLVCGSAGFLMSNFIRYVLYRSRNFEIASVDNTSEMRKVYFHKHHSFHVGDVSNYEFMKKVVLLEKPDFIINPIGYCPIFTDINKVQNAINTITCLYNLQVPVVQLVHTPEYDAFGDGQYIANVSLSKNNCLILLPFSFGPRQNNGIVDLIKTIVNNKDLYFEDYVGSFSYVDDISSLIWFVVEKNIRGEIKMPALGTISIMEVVNIIEKLSGIKAIIKNKSETELNTYIEPNKEYSNKINGWARDSKSLEDSMEKTIKWYLANKWSLI